MEGRDLLKLLIFFMIGMSLLVGMLWWVGIDKLLSAMQRASIGWLLVVGLLVFPAYFVRAVRWRLLLLPVKNKVSLSTAFWTTAIGFMVNTLIPIRLGEFVRAYILGEKEKIGFAPSFSSIIVERTLDLIGLLTLGLISMLMLPVGSSLPGWALNGFKIVSVLIGVILAVIFLGIKKETLIIKLVSEIFKHIPFIRKRVDRITDFTRSLIHGLRGLSQEPRIFAANLSLTWLLWLIYCFMVYAVFAAFGYEISIVAVVLGGVLLNMTYILPAAPGYVGTYEAYWTLIFTALGVFQVDVLLAMGLISHLLGIAMMIALGCIGIMWLGLSFSEAFKVRSD